MRKQAGLYYSRCKHQNDLMRADLSLNFVGVGDRLSSNVVIDNRDDVHLSFYGLAGLKEIIQTKIVLRYVV